MVDVPVIGLAHYTTCTINITSIFFLFFILLKPQIFQNIFWTCIKLFIYLFILCVLVKRSTVDIRNRPRIPVPDEDPYSVASNGGGSSGSSGGSVHQGPPRRSDKPPKLPPRDNNPYPHHIPKVSH